MTHIQIVGAEPLNVLDLNEILYSFWELELLGITSMEGEKSIHEEFEEEVIYKDERY